MKWIERFNRFENNETLVKNYTEYALFLDKVYEEVDRNDTLKIVLQDSPYTKGLFLSALLDKSSMLLSMGAKRGIDPCTSPEMKRYLQYHRAFYLWVTGKSDQTFTRLSARKQKNIKNLFMFRGGEKSYYIVGKYICKTPVGYRTKEEDKLYRRGAGERVDLASDYIRYSHPDDALNDTK